MRNILAQALSAEEAGGAATGKQLLLGRLLERLAHEMRNPLSSLDIHVQLLVEDLGRLPARTRARLGTRLDIIRGELRRLDVVMKQFARLAGPSELELEEVEVAGVIEYVADLLRPEAARRCIRLETRLKPALPKLWADRVQLIQALVNLVINALQAVDRDGRVTVATARHRTRPLLGLEVRDTGPGVSADKKDTIFEPFYTTKSHGSGLGLWIVQQIAAAHGGQVQVANRPRGGAVFALWLPMQRPSVPHG